MYQIYALVDPRKPDIVRYVGQTKKLLKIRLQAHLDELRRHKRLKHNFTHKDNWINNLLVDNVKPLIVAMEEEIDQSRVNEREIFWISHYRGMGQADLNVSDGGVAMSPENFREMNAERNRRKGKLTVEERKALWLFSPADAPRPNKKENFANFLNEKSDQYDPDFTKQIREKFPHWFVENRVVMKKQELLSMPAGSKRPLAKSPLGSALSAYTVSYEEGFDSGFNEKIRAKFPEWFNEDRVKKNIEILLSVPSGSQTPLEMKNVLRNYTAKGKNYKAEFDAQIRQKQPQWFLKRGEKL